MSLFAKLFFREFIYTFLLSWFLFAGLIWIFLFLRNIFIFLNSPLSLSQYFFIELKILPVWVDVSLPIAWVFSLCVAVSNLRDNREWFGIWEAGVSTGQIRLPYIILACLLGVGSLIWQDFISIPLSVKREQERADMLGLTPESRELILVNMSERSILWVNNFNFLRQTIEQPLLFFFDKRGDLAWSIQSFSASFNREKIWIFKEARVWSYRGGYPCLKIYPILEVTNLQETPEMLTLVQGNWELSTLGDLFKKMNLIRNKKKKIPPALEAQIYSRIGKSFSFLIMVFWAFWISFYWSSSNLVFSLMSSLSFNLTYTIIHLVLVQLSETGILSSPISILFEISSWIGILWFLYRRYY